MSQKKRLGDPGSATEAKQGTSSSNADFYTSNSNQRQPTPSHTSAEQELADKVAWQTIGLPRSIIKVLIHLARDTVEAAREEAASVAIVDVYGRVLAYRMPR
jgi:hypothetical protein